MNTGKWLIVFALLIMCIGLGTTQASAAVNSVNNNFTMINEIGGLTGGTNDVVFTWDGTHKTSVATSGQVSNASLSSTCPFFGITWSAHDVAIYGPGTYTIYDGCPAGSPGCGVGNAVTFTVGSGQLGAHILFDWGGNNDIDVVNVWVPNAAFGPSPMCADADNCGGQTTCGSNSAGTVWSYMSSDWDGDGFNGFGMTDGPFAGFNANFNVMVTICGGCVPADCNDNNACTSDICSCSGVCVHTLIVCNDNNACTVDSCNPATGCAHAWLSCPAFPPCTSDGICDPATGTCVFPPIDCNDNNACTIDTCDTASGACVHTPIVCNDNNACTIDTCNTTTGCVFTPINCDDGNASTVDTCDPVTGICVHTPFNPNNAHSINNNFTMINGTGGLTGGTNDVVFTWDLSKKISVATSGQVSNATLSSPCPFFSITWSAHDVAIYGPGTYTVYTECAAGSPGCGLGIPITFTVASNQLGVHVLFDWATSTNIDVVNIWVLNAVFGPSSMCADADHCGGQATCGSNSAGTAWSYMSSDGNGDGINGYPMVDGPFAGFNANFNVNVVGTNNNNFTMLNGFGGLTGGTNDVLFTWNGTKKTSVAASGQLSNAKLASTCPFFGVPWSVHDVAIYGPGTYTVYTDCPAGSPGCGTTTSPPITFTVATGQVGVHMLFDWGGNNDTDVVDVWVPNAIFGPSPMYTGPDCGTGNPAQIWDWMSSDWNGDGINGYPMVDGPFAGFNANFNTMGSPPLCGCCDAGPRCNDNNPCTIDGCTEATGVCIHTIKVCNDNNLCTVDTCNTATGACVSMPKNCNDNNACTTDTCATATGVCGHTTIFCNDNKICTDDSCDTVKGCVFTPNTLPCPIGSTNNNFTMVNPTGGTIGGTNDVVFTWDGTRKTSVAVYGQVTSALITSTCPFQGITWSAHDVAIYGPGTYTVYAGCPAGSPGCGLGTAMTFTVGANQLGVHMLFDWGASKNIDVVNVWNQKVAFAPSPLWTGACGSQAATKVWDLMSSDFDGDGISGKKMVDGPFIGFGANFNLMGVNLGCPFDPQCNDNNPCTNEVCSTATGVCSHTPIVCNDNNACTTDTCNTATGCVFTPIACNDNNACTSDSCNPATGCVYTPIVCNDNVACTSDSCDPATGCVYTSTCPTGQTCTPSGCTSGCITGADCYDGNQCTYDFCNTATGVCSNPPIPCDDNNACTSDRCNPAGSICEHTAINCNDNNNLTIDTCDPATGNCVHIPINPNDVYSINNNFTMINGTGGLTGGTNDVVFTWDRTKKTSVAASGQVSNATLTSVCPFFGITWSAHDVAIYGPGTYTVYTECPAGSPGCGLGIPITFTVASNQLGVHVLFDWATSTNIDVVNIWVPNTVFGPSSMCADADHCGGQATCGSNSAGTAWSYMSSDGNGDGINGYPMVDGPFAGFNANFNVNYAGTINNNFTLLNGFGGITGGTNDVMFTWNGTKKTSVAASGQVSNASLSSTCPFFGVTWSAHDVAIYGPGTYTVYDGCPAGSPGCGVGNPVTFTVATGQLGVHMLFDWGGNNETDVVDVWVPNAAFGLSPMCADANNCGGQVTCGSNPATKVWDWMSSDWNGDGINGAPMTDGPFAGFNANFNVMGGGPSPCGCCDSGCNDNNACTIDTCNTSTGVCTHPIKVCNDNNPCTTDTCNTANGACVFTPKNCSDNNACTADACNIATGACTHTPIVCNDNNPCTTETCNTATGCVFTLPGTCSIYTTNNNFTMVDPAGKTIGGENSIIFAWDGSKKTSVAATGQISNAVITSTCPFQGVMWKAHDVAIYGPGTYTVYAGCAAGGPGCGTGTPITFTVGAGQLGGHMLFNWGVSSNIDILDIWVPNAVFGPSTLWTGACGSNPADKVWDLMSSDSNGDGKNGYPMVDGPFLNFSANFNLMAPCPASCDDNNACTVDSCVFAACVHTPIVCNDGNSCTTDTCTPATGQCVYTDNGTCRSTNNFTMIDPTNTAFGGTNDVAFTWDGTKKTSVAVSGQVSNATISSTCPFFGVTWAAHDVTVYGPGTYTVYSGCAAGSPGCGSGAPITFTVAAAEIGIHMLFDWNGNLNIDVVNVLKPNSVSSNMWTGACGSNPANRVWMWASYDFDGDGINGTPMVDGPFVGMNANFNLMMADCPDAARCNDNNACTIDPCFAPSVCTYTPVNCDDNNACTADSCNPSTGCVHTPIICNDNNACTSDSCNPATGCVYTIIPGCGEDCGECLGDFECPTGMKCNASTLCLVSCSCPQCTVCAGHCVVPDCNDNNACTMDTYVAGTGCIHTPIVCNDNNGCTIDTCNTSTGCVYTPRDCNDNNVCTIDTCDVATGNCGHYPKDCNDNNACTIDTCDKATGTCIHTFKCMSEDPCSPFTCDPAIGICVPNPVVCNDNNACTIDTCNPATGCVYTPIVCNDNNLCTNDSCNVATGCVFTPKVCNDNNVCTADSCNSATGVCVYTPVPDGTACGSGGTCLSGTCQDIGKCPKGSKKSVRLSGTGSMYWWIEKQIRTEFTVKDKTGCILRYTESTITVTPGTVLKVNWKVGTAPNPTSVTWLSTALDAKKVPYYITCPTSTGTVGDLVLSNTSAKHGKDTDTLTVSTATN